jgi:carboxyl-terminal processing protease
MTNRLNHDGRDVLNRLRTWLSVWLIVVIVALLTATVSATPDNLASKDNLDETTALASFDQVWKQVRDQYFDYQRLESDWEAARERLRPQAAETRDLATLRDLLHELLEVIGESHFTVIPSEAYEHLSDLVDSPDSAGQEAAPGAPRAATGLSVRVIDGAVRVTEVRAHSPADEAGIKPGWMLVSVDDFELKPVLERLEAMTEPADRRRSVALLEYRLMARVTHTRPGREIDLSFLDVSDHRREYRLVGAPMAHGAVQIGNLPPMTFDFSLKRLETDTGCVSLIRFSTWVPALADEFRSRRDQIFACDGMVLDVRGNPGGVLPTMVTLATDLFDETARLGTLLRSDGHIDFRVLPRRVDMDGNRLTPFSGPIAILIDRMSGSTSEMFAAGMQATERARLFGERSAGMALPAQMLPLASGDILMYAFADYRDSLDRRIEGVGAEPDHLVVLTPDNLSQTPSPVLQAALDWISDELQ